MSDPTTKDLIEESRERPCIAHPKQDHPRCGGCLRAALADRLEEVEAREPVLKAVEHDGHTTVHIRGVPYGFTPSPLGRKEARRLAQHITDRFGSPEPSDPSWDATVDEIHAELAGEKEPPEPSDPGPEKPPAQSTTEPDYPEPEYVDTRIGRRSDPDLVPTANDVPDRAESVEPDYPPEYDPWDDLRNGFPHVDTIVLALFGLRKRVEGLDAATRRSADTTFAAFRGVWGRIQKLEERIEDGPDGEVQSRLLRLADNQLKAATGRATLRKDLERVCDLIEKLAERLDAVDGLVDTVAQDHRVLRQAHAALVGDAETLVERVERLESGTLPELS